MPRVRQAVDIRTNIPGSVDNLIGASQKSDMEHGCLKSRNSLLRIKRPSPEGDDGAKYIASPSLQLEVIDMLV